MGHNEGSLSTCGNVEEDDTPDLAKDLSRQCFGALQIKQTNNTTDDVIELEDIAYDGLENVAGFICNKLKVSDSSTSTVAPSSYTWVDHLSEGGLAKPSPQLMQHMEELETIFQNFNGGQDLLITKGYLSQLLETSSAVQCEETVKKLFFRSRMYFRIRKLNENLSGPSLYRKRKMTKTVT